MDFRGAEDLVTAFLQAKGWDILARNFRRRGFELDIVASLQGTISIVEVKLRRLSSSYPCDLSSLVPWRKQAALKRGALCFVTERGLAYHTLRFDLALVKQDQQKNKKGKNVTKEATIDFFVNVLPS